MSSENYFVFLDLVGTWAFASSGAIAARQRGFDLFGVAAIAYVVACGGGIVRDLCLSAIPPAGLSDWRYLAVALLAAAAVMLAGRLVRRLEHPVLLFDALGLGFFAVSSANKALALGQNAQVAVLLGITAAVGGGVVRDVLLNRVPVILQHEIYASAALLGASIVVIGTRLGVSGPWLSWVAIASAVGLRLLSIHYSWHLYRFSDEEHDR